jgi:flavin reductase (DIM6/NTAB) family NADH-FMN oxidoreductase RutF
MHKKIRKFPLVNYNFSQLDNRARYSLLTHSICPRPIAWVLTENENGTHNLAPFSYFNVVCSSPALLMISVGHKRDGSKKDTWENLESRHRGVVHIADQALMQAVNESAKTLPSGESELEYLNLTLTQDGSFLLPRIAEAPIAFDCKMHDLHLLGDGPQAVIYLEVEQAYVSDALVKEGEFSFDELALDPLARLGGANYVGLGERTTIKRPE